MTWKQQQGRATSKFMTDSEGPNLVSQQSFFITIRVSRTVYALFRFSCITQIQVNSKRPLEGVLHQSSWRIPKVGHRFSSSEPLYLLAYLEPRICAISVGSTVLKAISVGSTVLKYSWRIRTVWPRFPNSVYLYLSCIYNRFRAISVLFYRSNSHYR